MSRPLALVVCGPSGVGKVNCRLCCVQSTQNRAIRDVVCMLLASETPLTTSRTLGQRHHLAGIFAHSLDAGHARWTHHETVPGEIRVLCLTHNALSKAG